MKSPTTKAYRSRYIFVTNKSIQPKNNIMKRLRRMGASYFVSRLFYEKIDNTHLNWRRAGSQPTRNTNFNNSSDMHIDYLRAVIGMSPNRLNTNAIGLSGREIIEMANELLQVLE